MKHTYWWFVIRRKGVFFYSLDFIVELGTRIERRELENLLSCWENVCADAVAFLPVYCGAGGSCNRLLVRFTSCSLKFVSIYFGKFEFRKDLLKYSEKTKGIRV